ncbi:hypothetical protein [Clostridium akagii]|uniref:hypothetical protein n=1 Tax=Clostridium akagii TaxID=91623 RepID=UPI00047AF106|nr:hypothetical protein [Clostridium akagii]
MNKFITIILYLLPILLVSILTKRITCFLFSAGIMTIILGFSMEFIPNIIRYKKNKSNAYICIIVAGFCLIWVSLMN